MTEKTQSLYLQEKMLRGSAWLTFSNVASRLLGALYIIPWYAWMGTHAKQANSLFSMGYTIYALFLMISTAGIPGAIAKLIARYNSMKEFRVSQKVLYRALQLSLGLGIIFAGLMYVGAPWLAKISGGGTVLVPIIRMLCFALVTFPSMSVIRGYFQGNNTMEPFAISQVAEQVIRVLYMILSAFFIMQVWQGNYVTAVSQSTFAAFVGMLASYGVLLYFLKKEAPFIRERLERSRDQVTFETRVLVKEIVKEALPFIVLGAGVTVFKLVDQVTFIATMKNFTGYSHDQLLELFSLFSANPDKLTMVVVAIATSIALTGMPLITSLATQGNRHELGKMLSLNLQLFVYLITPATFGLILLAYPLNTVFYSADRLGSYVLIESAVAALFIGLFTVASTLLQGLDHDRSAVFYWLIGLIIKSVIQVPLIRVLEVYGPLLATMLGLAVTCSLSLYKLRKVAYFDHQMTLRRSLLVFFVTMSMCALAFGMRQLCYLFLTPESGWQAFLICLLTAIVGAISYFYFTLKIRLVDRLFGPRAKVWRRRLKIR